MHPPLRGDYKEITENNLIRILEGKKILKGKNNEISLMWFIIKWGAPTDGAYWPKYFSW